MDMSSKQIHNLWRQESPKSQAFKASVHLQTYIFISFWRAMGAQRDLNE